MTLGPVSIAHLWDLDDGMVVGPFYVHFEIDVVIHIEFDNRHGNRTGGGSRS